jgi:hypothetical protein
MNGDATISAHSTPTEEWSRRLFPLEKSDEVLRESFAAMGHTYGVVVS